MSVPPHGASDSPADHESYDLGDVMLSSGTVLPSAKIAFKVHGSLNHKRDNAILFPTWFGDQHTANEWIIGPGHALDPNRYCIIVVDILGNGMSSSPSTTPPPFDRTRFPRISGLDNVVLQRRLLTERFGVDQLALFVGRSMGAQLAFQWGAYFPDGARSLLAFVGSARTSAHNHVFIQTIKAALTSDPAWNGGEYLDQPESAHRHMRLVFDSWCLSQAFYRAGLHLALGFATMDEYLNRPEPGPWPDANDLLAQADTWEHADLSANERFEGDVERALGAVEARTIVMPSRTDLYFPPEDSAVEVSMMPNAELRVIESIWGHRAGAPDTDPADTAFIEQAIGDLLEP